MGAGEGVTLKAATRYLGGRQYAWVSGPFQTQFLRGALKDHKGLPLEVTPLSGGGVGAKNSNQDPRINPILVI